jgi:sugar/nucleoside kinase (ribokinase family)
MAEYDLIGVGGLAYDLVLRVDHLPIVDEKYPARLIGKLPGGFIANATCAAARLGLRTGYIGWVGDDSEGAMLRQDFLEWGVDPVGLVCVLNELTPFTVVITDVRGYRAILLPASRLYDLPFSPEQLTLAGQARVILTFPRDLQWFGHLRRRSREAGGLLAMDVENTVPIQGHELRQAIRLTDVVFLKHSSLPLIGVYALRDLVQPGQWIIQTAGGRGAYGIEAGMDEPIFRPALPVEAVDTTGAGDCFHAALLVAKLDGATLAEALEFANAAAAIKVQYHGARGGLPTRDEIEALL